jgi:hypothetical protein
MNLFQIKTSLRDGIGIPWHITHPCGVGRLGAGFLEVMVSNEAVVLASHPFLY